MATKKDEQKLEKNTRDLLRELLGTLKLKDIQPLNELDPEMRRNLCRYCYGVVNNPFFKMIGKDLSLQIMQHMAVGTKDFQEDLNNRMTLNGIQMVGELFERYSAEWENRYAEKRSVFDPHKSFEPTKQLADI